MKKIIVLLSLVLSSIAFANTNVEDKAFSTLLKLNPQIETYEGEKASLLDVLAPLLLLKLDENNYGILATATNSCTLEGSEYACVLSVNSADVTLNDNGDYVKSEEAIESSLVIVYKLDKKLQKILELNFYYAG